MATRPKKYPTPTPSGEEKVVKTKSRYNVNLQYKKINLKETKKKWKTKT